MLTCSTDRIGILGQPQDGISVKDFDDIFFFFKQKTAYEMRISDWSSDVCSSDLFPPSAKVAPPCSGSDSAPGRRWRAWTGHAACTCACNRRAQTAADRKSVV